jgi:UDP-N-acetylglucosamine:LPS N-acetylglucosamine transferase
VQLGLAAASLSKEHMTEEQVTTALALVLHNHDIRDKMVAASEAAKKADGLGRLIEEAKKLINYSVSHPPS